MGSDKRALEAEFSQLRLESQSPGFAPNQGSVGSSQQQSIAPSLDPAPPPQLAGLRRETVALRELIGKLQSALPAHERSRLGPTSA